MRAFIGQSDCHCKLWRDKIDSERPIRCESVKKKKKREAKGGEIGSERECPIIVLVTIEPSCLRATFMWIRWENRKVKIPLFRPAIPPGVKGDEDATSLHTQEESFSCGERTGTIVSFFKPIPEKFSRDLPLTYDISAVPLFLLLSFDWFLQALRYFTLVVCCTIPRREQISRAM